MFEVGSDFASFPTGNIARVQDRANPASTTTRSSHNLVGSFGEGQRIADGEVNPKKNVAYNNFEFEQGAFFDHVIEATGKTVTPQRSIDSGTFETARTRERSGNCLHVYTINVGRLNAIASSAFVSDRMQPKRTPSLPNHEEQK